MQPLKQGRGGTGMILLIDNYDSFSYNLYQLIGSVYPDIRVIRNDDCTVEEIEVMQPAALILSPGPGQAGGCGHLHSGDPVFCRKASDPRRLPRASGDLRGVWRNGHLCKAADAWKAKADPSDDGKPDLCRHAGDIFGSAVSFACGKEGNASVGAGRYGRVRGRRSHGSRASERSDIWTAISSGIGHDAGRKENDRKFYKMCGKI